MGAGVCALPSVGADEMGWGVQQPLRSSLHPRPRTWRLQFGNCQKSRGFGGDSRTGEQAPAPVFATVPHHPPVPMSIALHLCAAGATARQPRKLRTHHQQPETFTPIPAQ